MKILKLNILLFWILVSSIVVVKGAGLNNLPISILNLFTNQCVTDTIGAIYFIQPPKSQVNHLESISKTMVPSASFFGKEYIERIGYALAGAGDVNGDGFDDFMIGTFHNAVMGSDAGAAYLFLGHAYLRWELDDSVAHADARFLGQKAYDAAGYSVALNGDLNGDGFDDMIIGAPAGNDKVPYMPGRVYIVFGKQQADWGRFIQLYDSSQVIYEGEGNQDLAGLSVAYIGDVNGDGYDDFLVGAPFKDGSYEDMGKVYLVLGKSGPWLKTDYLSGADAGFIYEHEDAQVGYSVAGVGDVNDDGVPDFAIGATGASRVFIIYGRTSVDWGKSFNLDNADLILYGSERWVNEGVGWRAAGNGDLNGDGIADMIIAAINDNDAATLAGKVYVLFGRSGGWSTSEIALKDGDASYIGEQATDQAGWGLAIAGDIDGDGFDDFLIGTYKDNHGPVDGKAYLIKGKTTGWQMNVPLGTIPDFCERDPSGIGYSVTSAGDFDADGLADYIIAAPFNSDIQKWNGKVYLFASQEIPYEISGNISCYQSGYSIPRATVWVDTLSAASDISDNRGQYQAFVRGKHDHTIKILKETGQDVGSSITSYDAALIAQLSINLSIPDTINTEAADVNLDGKISMYDAANALRYAVELPRLADSHAGEWRFIPDSIYYDSVVTHYLDQNYVGFVRGDVDLSWRPPGSGLRKSNSDESPISSEIAVVGNEIVLPIACNQEMPLVSFDLDIAYDQTQLKLLRIDKTDLTANFQLAYNRDLNNKLKIGAYNQQPIKTPGTLLNIVFKSITTKRVPTGINIDKFLVNNKTMNTATVYVSNDQPGLVPDKFELHQNYPNPFKGQTTIQYDVPRKGHISVAIYNLLGEAITTLRDGTGLPGKYQLSWDGKDRTGKAVASGVYICKFSHSTGNDMIKILYMK